jgi:hypothetical protein
MDAKNYYFKLIHQPYHKCGAVFIIGSPSSSADEMVGIGKEKGKLFLNIKKIL